MIDQVFGRWTVLSKAQTPKEGQRRARWLCRCVCGTERAVTGHHLRGGRSKSCGCVWAEVVVASRRAQIARSRT